MFRPREGVASHLLLPWRNVESCAMGFCERTGGEHPNSTDVESSGERTGGEHPNTPKNGDSSPQLRCATPRTCHLNRHTSAGPAF